jgi:hypothetical protein
VPLPAPVVATRPAGSALAAAGVANTLSTASALALEAPATT